MFNLPIKLHHATTRLFNPLNALFYNLLVQLLANIRCVGCIWYVRGVRYIGGIWYIWWHVQSLLTYITSINIYTILFPLSGHVVEFNAITYRRHLFLHHLSELIIDLIHQVVYVRGHPTTALCQI